jgi:hypothetical protein
MDSPVIEAQTAGAVKDILRNLFQNSQGDRSMKIRSAAVKMFGVLNTTNVCVMSRTADTGTAGSDDLHRNAQPAPDLIHSADKFFLRLYRETVAILTPALTAEFFPVKELDLIPEGSSCIRIGFLL